MSRYIDADTLYEKVAEWEARALAVVEKLNSKPFEEMDANEITEWRKWSCILNERSAFKFDVEDEPTADVVEVVRCKDCIHNHEHETPFESKFHICNLNKLAFTQYAGFYCAYGERKEEVKK